MIYLDTHAVVWLSKAETDWLSRAARRMIDQGDLLVSPMAVLELHMLWEKKRIRQPPARVVDDLAGSVGLRICDLPFERVVRQAFEETWTRDPFDRIIVAHARVSNAPLLTMDAVIRRHYRKAIR